MNRPRISLFALIAGSALSATVLAQSQQPAQSQPPAGTDPAAHAAHVAQGTRAQTQPATQTVDTGELMLQLADLRVQVARLQAALDQGHATGGAQQPRPQDEIRPELAGSSMPSMGMPRMASGSMSQGGSGASGIPSSGSGAQGMSNGGRMGMMDRDKIMLAGTTGGMSGGSASGNTMGMMDQMMGMGMSRMGGGMSMGGMASALPGYPGASHIYHIGATGFFLDHGSHITLTLDQQRQLAEIKEQSLLNQATLQRRVDQAEQELWDLTGADAPDATKVESKAREIEQLKSEQRIAFIRDVGKAAGVLTDDQRMQLSGMLPANPIPINQQSAMPRMSDSSGAMSDM